MPIVAKPKQIWQVSLVDTEGHEQAGERPAIILAVHSDANVCMCVPCTSNLDTLRFPYSHRINPSVTNGFTVPSIALVYQTRCLTATRLLRHRGIIDPVDIDAIYILVREYFDVPIGK